MRGYTIHKPFIFLMLLMGQVTLQADPTAAVTPKVGQVSAGILTSISLKAQLAKLKTLRYLGKDTKFLRKEFVSKNKEYLSVDDIISLTDFWYEIRYPEKKYDVKEKTYVFSIVDYLTTKRFKELQPKHLWYLINEQTSSWFYTNLSPLDKKNSVWALHLLETYPEQIARSNFSFLLIYLSELEKQTYIINAFKKHAKKLNVYILIEYLKALSFVDKEYWVEHFIKNDYTKINDFFTDFLDMLSPVKQEACALYIIKLHQKTLYHYQLKNLFPFLSKKEQHYWSAFLLDQHLHDFINSRYNSYNYFSQSNKYCKYELTTIIEYLPNKNEWSLKVLENYFDRLPILQAEVLLEYISDKKKSLWQKKILIKKFNPIFSYLSHCTFTGPLFSDYFIKYSLQSIVNPNHPHFTALLPQIFDYVTTEYKNNRIVFFHGQQSQWSFLERLFKELYQLTEKKPIHENFIWLRYKKLPGLSDAQVADHFKTFSYENRPFLLFGNLHLFANWNGSNSWHYTTYNSDQTTGKNYYNVTHRMQSFFEEVGLSKEYEQVKKDCLALHALHKDALSTLGNHGTLLVISMPEATARAISYSASPGGPERKIKINGTETSDVVTIAHNFEQVPFDNEYCIILGPDMCDPERAAKAGISMKRFNPVITSRTKKYQKFEEELGKLMAKVKQLYERRMASESAKK